jgi:hypothetical protein
MTIYLFFHESTIIIIVDGKKLKKHSYIYNKTAVFVSDEDICETMENRNLTYHRLATLRRS